MAGYIDFYEVLGIARDATAAEIEAAYDRQLKHLESGQHGMDAALASKCIKQADQAYWMLSDKNRRAVYDTSLETAAAMPVQFAVAIKTPRWTTPSGSMHLIKRAVVVLALSLFGYALLGHGIRNMIYGDPDFSEQKKIRKSYDAINGKMSDEEREAGASLAEKKQFDLMAEHEKQQREIARHNHGVMLERDRRYAAQVSSELRDAEENARRQAESERQREADLEQEKQEQERQRVERLQEKWQSANQRQSRRDESE